MCLLLKSVLMQVLHYSCVAMVLSRDSIVVVCEDNIVANDFIILNFVVQV